MTLLSLILVACFAVTATPNNEITGAWMNESGSVNNLLLLQDGYLTLTQYDPKEKKFFYSKGGKYKIDNGKLSLNCEFSSANKEEVGKTFQYRISRNGNELKVQGNGTTTTFKFIDSSSTALSGCWRINGRKNENGEMYAMNLQPRRTLKILTGSRFQWMAINVETGQFSATGGGTYTFKDGKYTEHIEFFSRDSSRIGKSLTFDGEIKDDLWHHSGSSSKGAPIYETWVKY